MRSSSSRRFPLLACWLALACETRISNQEHRDEKTDSSARPSQVAVPIPVAAASSAGDNNLAETGGQACNRLPFFDFYRNARLITVDEPSNVRLQIHIDYHTGAGCMAPDGFGTDLIITLHLRAQGSDCFVKNAEVRAVDWGLQQSMGSEEDRKLRFDFTAFQVLERVDLTSPELTALAIHNPEHAVSALIRRTGVLWYEETRRDSLLHTSVDTQGEEAGCCWPATSTRYRDYGVYE